MKKFDQIDRIIAKYPQLSDFSGPVTEERILQAEEQLNLSFPEDYKRFLASYGAGSFGGFEIYGIVPNADLKRIPNGIWLTEDLREKDHMPESYLAIGFDGFGGYYCIDTKNNINEAAPIVIFVCDGDDDFLYHGDNELEAENFTEFLLEAMKLEIDFGI